MRRVRDGCRKQTWLVGTASLSEEGLIPKNRGKSYASSANMRLIPP